MIHVMVYFWNRLRVHITMEITCSPMFFLPWSLFIHPNLVFRLTLSIILLGQLEAYISHSNHMLFEDYNNSCEPTYYKKEKLKKIDIFTIVLTIK
jgi:hypothetical protein